jgi:hypothetical protein
MLSQLARRMLRVMDHAPANADAANPLDALRGLRSAPSLTAEQRQDLLAALQSALGRCSWFTVGVMAPSAQAGLLALRQLEQRWGWTPLQPSPDAVDAGASGGVFLKGNQATGLYALRSEAGLGEGILITGHNAEAPEAENTWGPFPLDFFG